MDAISFAACDNATLSGIQYNIIIAWFEVISENSREGLNPKNLILSSK